ncbi:MAG TPA: hypothetical protein VM431_00250 [Phycisphaerae bacterium]|nr:hypothetical protein [Phycisphaerae bacterium]
MTLDDSLPTTRNRLAMPALLLAVAGVAPQWLLGVMGMVGVPYRFFSDHSWFLVWNLVQNGVGLVCFAAAMAGLVLGVAAVTQIRCRGQVEGGRGLAYAAIVVVIGGMGLMRLVWLVGGLVSLITQGF